MSSDNLTGKIRNHKSVSGRAKSLMNLDRIVDRLRRRNQIRYCEDTGHPLEWDIPLKHFRQRYSWDCGLACVTMVLPEKHREHFHDNFNEICRSAGFNKSTWTIDLCFLLSRYHIPHTFTTLTLGVRNDYKENSFYEKVFSKDEERVNFLFQKAHSLPLDVRKERVTIEDILKHLLTGPAIILTNSQLLNCETCKHNKLSMDLKKCLPIPMTVSYEGHYVVACGYNIRKQVIYYRNPVFYDRVCSMRFSSFNDARKCFGTDEDLIFIHTKN